MKAIGIKINIQNYDANTFFGTNLPNGTYQIAEFAWVATPFVSANQSIYCSYTNTTNCDDNWIHYANPQVDKLMAEGSPASSPTQEAADYNAADKILWQDMATLPLYQKPQYFAWSNTTGTSFPTRPRWASVERQPLGRQVRLGRIDDHGGRRPRPPMSADGGSGPSVCNGR